MKTKEFCDFGEFQGTIPPVPCPPCRENTIVCICMDEFCLYNDSEQTEEEDDIMFDIIVLSNIR